MYRNTFRTLSLLLLLVGILLAGCASQSTSGSTSTTTKASSFGNLPTSSIVDNSPVQSKGCGLKSTLQSGHTFTESIVSSGNTRSFLLHIPAGYKDNVQQPLVLNFHGHGSTSQRQAATTKFSQLADQYDFIVAYPQGTIGPDGHTGWATGPARNPQVNDVLFVSNLLNELQSTLCVNPERIYATGFSNGGGMTNVLACKMADRIAAFAPVSGAYPAVPGGCTPARPVSLMEFHGTGDTVVPYNGSVVKGYPPVQQWLSSWVKLDSCMVTPTITYPSSGVTEYEWQRCQDGVVIIHYQLAGWPHAWPTTDTLRQVPVKRTPTKPQKHAPPISTTINASPIIWSFFQSHPLTTNA